MIPSMTSSLPTILPESLLRVKQAFPEGTVPVECAPSDERTHRVDMDRLASQLRFILEIDKLKSVFRQTLLLDRSRLENDAEHSWHLAVMALLLSEYARERDIDLSRVVGMVLVHDIVEVDAGDTYLYDETGRQDKADRERAAADRLFALLPSDQASEIRGLWEEFEAAATPEARFAAALDRFQPLLHNCLTEGEQWRKHGVTVDRVLKRVAPAMAAGAPELWAYAESLIHDAVEKGYLAKAPDAK